MTQAYRLLAEKNGQKNAFGQSLPLAENQDYLGMLMDALRGLTVGAGGTDSAVARAASLLSAALPMMGGAKALKGALSAETAVRDGGEAAHQIRAFHGSPHDFERFDLSKIGTGEGAQAYGHGLYFAENEGTARAYRDNLSPVDVTSRADGAPISSDMQRLIVDSWNDLHGRHLVKPQMGDAMDLVDDALMRQRADAMKARDGEWFNKIEDLRLEARRVREAMPQMKGKMYEVGIHAHPDDFLDWDKPIGQQAQPVQEAVKRARDKAMGDVRPVRLKDGSYGVTRINADGSGNVIPGVSEATPEAAVAALQREAEHGSGQWAYDSLSKTIRKPGAFPEISIPDKAAAASALKEQGIPGIKYLDQGSRAAGEGSRNFVVFDDRIVSVLKKYGVALPVIEGLRRKAQQNGGRIDTAELDQVVP